MLINRLNLTFANDYTYFDNTTMKRFFSTFIALFCIGWVCAFAQAELKFDKTSHNFGTFYENEIQKVVFTFTNAGNEPLVIHQVITGCGCTVAKFTQTPVQPGKKGEIEIVYNGKGKLCRHFEKPISVRSNAKSQVTRIYIEGTMKENKPQK